MKIKLHIWWALIVCSLRLQAQDPVKIFTQDQVIDMVEKYHPVSVQANLLIRQGESTIRKARGAFDPIISSNIDQKYFDDKEYYNIVNAGLKIPTWYGVEFKAGFDQNSGQFLNPEDSNPDGGLIQAGVSVSVGQGLIIDKRRATLRQAQIFAESTFAEQQKIMNDLLFDAINQYWDWVESWNQYLVYEESVLLASVRFEAVKRSYQLGELPAIDTLESFIQVQNRQMSRNQSRLEYQKRTLDLSNFLWFDNNTPLEITDGLQPPNYKDVLVNEIVPADSLQRILSTLRGAHPDMLLYGFKLSSMEIDRRLKAEALKPKLNLNYNALSERVGNEFVSDFSTQNYKWGLEFSIPIILRQERGDLELAKIKIMETEQGQQQKLLELQNKVRSYYVEHVNLSEQIVLFSSAVENYNSLLLGERQKFNNGESSLFLINSRETGLIQSRLKLIKIIAKYHIAYEGIDWARGVLYEVN